MPVKPKRGGDPFARRRCPKAAGLGVRSPPLCKTCTSMKTFGSSGHASLSRTAQDVDDHYANVEHLKQLSF